jgi:diguanylate cyclase (GGDEF)-like protein
MLLAQSLNAARTAARLCCLLAVRKIARTIHPQMHSLYHCLLARHPQQLTPFRCTHSTIAQLHRIFEDVVLENNLNALVVETLPTALERSAREISRVRQLARTARDFFIFASPHDPLARVVLGKNKDKKQPLIVRRTDLGQVSERFVVISDPRFSALLTSIRTQGPESNGGDLVAWTFEPEIIYTALEYLLTRVTAENSFHSAAFTKAVRYSAPKATSLQLTLGVTTKLARFLQEQSEREIALNRIGITIRNSMELESILQTAANEVGRTVAVRSCAVSIPQTLLGDGITRYYFHPDAPVDEKTLAALLGEIQSITSNLKRAPKASIVDGEQREECMRSSATIPLVYKGAYIGVLRVDSDDPARIWSDNEILMLHTVADQLSIAVKQAHLFVEMQQEALTDGLTGCYNRRCFELQLERDLHLATRMRQPISLIKLDVDHFQNINARAGHEVGDIALRTLAETLRSELRAVDTAARFSEDEFAIILPQAAIEGARIVAERLRQRIEETPVAGYGKITASFGVATFPAHASSRETIIEAADQALAMSKNSGRNCISTPPDEDLNSDFESEDVQRSQSLLTTGSPR